MKNLNQEAETQLLKSTPSEKKMWVSPKLAEENISETNGGTHHGGGTENSFYYS